MQIGKKWIWYYSKIIWLSTYKVQKNFKKTHPVTSYCKIAGYKLNIKVNHFSIYQYKQVKFEINIIAFTLANKKKYLGINLANYVQIYMSKSRNLWLKNSKTK